jgi:hypothetical protein
MTLNKIISSLIGLIVASHGDWYVFIDNGFEAKIMVI